MILHFKMYYLCIDLYNFYQSDVLGTQKEPLLVLPMTSNFSLFDMFNKQIENSQFLSVSQYLK